MCETLDVRTVKKTRKDHRCHGCAYVIPKGSSVLAVVSKDMGEISTGYWCDRCNEYVNSHQGLMGECFSYGELRHEIDEYFQPTPQEEK